MGTDGEPAVVRHAFSLCAGFAGLGYLHTLFYGGFFDRVCDDVDAILLTAC